MTDDCWIAYPEPDDSRPEFSPAICLLDQHSSSASCSWPSRPLAAARGPRGRGSRAAGQVTASTFNSADNINAQFFRVVFMAKQAAGGSEGTARAWFAVGVKYA